MYDGNRHRKNDPKSTVISLLVIALFLLPVEITATLILLTLFFLPVFLLIRKALRDSGKADTQEKKTSQAFDECPKPFCFHKDKGEHHLRKGREIYPWDRPDIDISKYQRK